MSAHVADEISLSSHSSSTENETKIFWPTVSSNTGVSRQNCRSLKGETVKTLTTTSQRRCCALSCVVTNSLLHPPEKFHRSQNHFLNFFNFLSIPFCSHILLNVCPYAQGKIRIAELTLGIHSLSKLSEFDKRIAIQTFQTLHETTRRQSSPHPINKSRHRMKGNAKPMKWNEVE